MENKNKKKKGKRREKRRKKYKWKIEFALLPTSCQTQLEITEYMWL
jgi:hypothetical protein